MANGSARREEFNPNRKFRVLVGFRLMGKDYARGEPFSRDLVNTRQLRQMYDNRNLEMDPAEKVETLAEYLKGVSPLSLMTVDELRGFLAKKGVNPRPGATRAALLDRAEKLTLETA